MTKEPSPCLQYFVWVDGDGTEHFFEVTGSQPYSDSEGMELKLTYNSANAADRYILIEDKGNNQMRFRVVQDYLAWLVWTKDASGNTTNYAYVSGYEAAGRIDTITDPAGRVTKFEYNGDLLSDIRIPDTSASSYRYEQTQGRFLCLDINNKRRYAISAGQVIIWPEWHGKDHAQGFIM